MQREVPVSLLCGPNGASSADYSLSYDAENRITEVDTKVTQPVQTAAHVSKLTYDGLGDVAKSEASGAGFTGGPYEHTNDRGRTVTVRDGSSASQPRVLSPNEMQRDPVAGPQPVDSSSDHYYFAGDERTDFHFDLDPSGSSANTQKEGGALEMLEVGGSVTVNFEGGMNNEPEAIRYIDLSNYGGLSEDNADYNSQDEKRLGLNARLNSGLGQSELTPLSSTLMYSPTESVLRSSTPEPS